MPQHLTLPIATSILREKSKFNTFGSNDRRFVCQSKTNKLQLKNLDAGFYAKGH